MQPPTNAEVIEQEAANWLAMQDAGPLSPELEHAFTTWLNSDSRHHAVFLRLRETWEKAGRFQALRPRGPVNEDLLEVEGTSGYPPRRRSLRSRGWLLRAAAVLALAGIAPTLLAPFRAMPEQVYTTTVGGFQRVRLPDGSTVHLNAASEIRVRFDAHVRRIELVRGEAQFSVAHEAHRAFDVSAGATTVRALGTVFAVRAASAGDVEIVVTTGRVAIASGTAPQLPEPTVDIASLPPSVPTLSAGSTAKVSRQGDVRIVHLTAFTHATPVREGRLWFERITLTQAAGEFNQHNTRQLEVADPVVANLRLSGAFDADDIDSFVAALATLGVLADTSDPTVTRLFGQER